MNLWCRGMGSWFLGKHGSWKILTQSRNLRSIFRGPQTLVSGDLGSQSLENFGPICKSQKHFSWSSKSCFRWFWVSESRILKPGSHSLAKSRICHSIPLDVVIWNETIFISYSSSCQRTFSFAWQSKTTAWKDHILCSNIGFSKLCKMTFGNFILIYKYIDR